MLWPTRGPAASTFISTVYRRGSSVRLIAGLRSGSSRRPTVRLYASTTAATGNPIHPTVNSPMVSPSSSSSP